MSDPDCQFGSYSTSLRLLLGRILELYKELIDLVRELGISSS